MKSFIEFVKEERLPIIPKRQLKVGNYNTKVLKTDSYEIEVLTTKESAINYILDVIFNQYTTFPPMDYRYFYEGYGLTKKDWENQWKEVYDEITNRDSDDGMVFLGIDDKWFNLEDISFDEFIWIYKNLNKLQFFSQEAGWGDVVFGGVIQPLDPFEEDEDSIMTIQTNFYNWITDEKYLIKKIGKTEVVFKDKINGKIYLK